MEGWFFTGLHGIIRNRGFGDSVRGDLDPESVLR